MMTDIDVNIATIIKEEIAQLSSVTIDPKDIKDEAWVIEFGLDSIRGVELMIALEERLDVILPDPDAKQIEKVSDIIRLVEAEVKSQKQLEP
ncbi:MAG: phosphopantetheine-binding protein [Deinococcales bacterium]